MEKLELDGLTFEGWRIPLPNSTLVFIRGRRGVLGCGFFNVETADRIGEALAVVSGVSTPSEMLSAEVRQVSRAAAELGVRPGDTGREALRKLG